MRVRGERVRVLLVPCVLLLISTLATAVWWRGAQAAMMAASGAGLSVRAQTLPGVAQTNTPPKINVSSVTLQQGTLANATIATVSDDETPAGSLKVEAVSVPAGVRIGLANTGGTITAGFRVDCTSQLGENAITLKVTDEAGLSATASLPVVITAGERRGEGLFPFVYPPTTTITAGGSAIVNRANEVVTNDALYQLYLQLFGNVTVSAPGFGGSFSFDKASGAVTISDAGPPGEYAVTVAATSLSIPFQCETLPKEVKFKLVVNPKPAGGCAAPSFSSPISYAAGSKPGAIVTADFNGDGKTDLAVANERGVKMLPGDGRGGFDSGTDYDTGFRPCVLRAGDFDGDGRLDLAIIGPASPFPALPGDVTVLFGDGNGGFSRNVRVPLSYTPQSMITGDFNGDGKADLVVANSGSETVGVFLNSCAIRSASVKSRMGALRGHFPGRPVAQQR